jgi:plastocyanin
VKTRLVAGIAVIVAVLVAGGIFLTRDAAPVTHVVAMRNLGFVPAHIDAHVGDTIVWKNEDIFVHTATDAGVFDTGDIAGGSSGQWVVDEEGTLEYLCTYHTTMRGTITVD